MGKDKRKLIFTSKGMNQRRGRLIIGRQLANSDVSNKRIILFTLREYFIYEVLIKACIEMGFREENVTIYDGEEHVEYGGIYDYVYVSEGNTFDIILMLRSTGMDKFIKSMVLDHKADYIGASAGAMLAGTSFQFAEIMDKNRVGINDCTGLELFDRRVVIVPHYTKRELERFKRNIEKEQPEILDRYEEVLHVSNYGVLVVEV